MADLEDDNDTNEPDNDADDQEGAIPTSDSTDAPETAQDDTGGQTGAAGVTGAAPGPGAAQVAGAGVTGGIPGSAQSGGGALSELMALVRAVQSYGMKQAMQEGQPTQQAASFEDGGSTSPDESDEAENDQQPAIPTSQAPSAPAAQTGIGGALGDRFRAGAKDIMQGIFEPEKNNTQVQAERQAKQQPPQAVAPQPAMPTTAQQPEPQAAPEASQNNVIPAVISQGMEGLKKYLSGDKAMDPNSVAGIGYAVDPQGTLPPVEKKMKMIQYAYQRIMEHTGDPREAMNGALGVFQHQRQEYGMWLTGAAVKLDQGDMGSALHAANQAFQAPFGENVHFAQSGGGTGVTATVTDDKGKVQGTFDMAPDQFSMLLHKHAQFDALAANGVFNTFSQMSGPMGEPQGPQQPAQTPAGAGPSQGPQQRSNADIDAEYAKPNGGNLTDEEVRQHDERHYPIMRAPQGVDRKLFDQSNELFPMLSQNRQRVAWIAHQQGETAKLESKEKIARIGADAKVAGTTVAQENINKRAETRETGRQDRFDKGWEHRTQAALLKLAGQNKNPADKNKHDYIHSMIAEHTGDPEGFKKALTDAGLNYERDILGQPGGPAAQQTPATPAQGATPQGAPQGGNTPAQGSPAGENKYKVGQVVQGYRFLGGNWRDRAAWVHE